MVRVYRFLLTPRWWGINVFVVVAIPICLFMGGWQLGRFEARLDNQQRAEQSVDQGTGGAPVTGKPLEELLPVDQETSGQQATATGRYDLERQFLVPDRTVDEQRGFYVLTLLRTTDGTGAEGRALPVVRGWLPGDPDPARVPAPPSGEVTVTGALQASEHRDSAGAHARGGLPAGQIGVISAAGLVNLVPYGVHNAWITVPDPAAPLRAVPPQVAEGTGLDAKAFQNLGYTAEWFAFVGFVLFMWYRFFRRDAEAARDRALGLDGGTGGAGGTGKAGAAGGGAPGTDAVPGQGRDAASGPEPGGSAGPEPETAAGVTPAGAAGRTGSPAASA